MFKIYVFITAEGGRIHGSRETNPVPSSSDLGSGKVWTVMLCAPSFQITWWRMMADFQTLTAVILKKIQWMWLKFFKSHTYRLCFIVLPKFLTFKLLILVLGISAIILGLQWRHQKFKLMIRLPKFLFNVKDRILKYLCKFQLDVPINARVVV